MNNQTEEEYVFLRACDNDFSMALKSLRLIDEHDFGYPQFVFLRDAAISYGRPFSPNRGIHKKNHILDSSIIPSEFSKLHQEIVTLRNTLFAHSDIAEKNPKLALLGDTKPIFAIEHEGRYLTDIKDRLKDMSKLIQQLQNALTLKKVELEKIIYNNSLNQTGANNAPPG